MIVREDVADNLPKCPRCGGKARRVEYIYEWTFHYRNKPEDKPKHEARIECADGGGKCYHTESYDFPDSVHYVGFGGAKLPDIDYESQWSYLDAEWTRLALSYADKKAYRDSMNSRRCECGKVPRKGWNYCPNCGKAVKR